MEQMNERKKIVVVGLGYVGLSIAVLLAKQCQVIGVDISEDKVTKINKKISPIEDRELSEFLSSGDLNITASTNLNESINSANFIIIATPTNFDSRMNTFDTNTLENIISDIVAKEPDATVVIKSTVPIGFTSEMRKKYKTNKILFSPEFLREGKALIDNLYPSRIVVGDKQEMGAEFADLLRASAHKEQVNLYLTEANEAEAIKLFSNTYLAMRVGFFNEIDNYCLATGLNSKDIINAVCADQRIGEFYNNPSFGYGGYCLPKDTKQLQSQYDNIPQNLVSGLIKSNFTRKQYIVNRIEKLKPKRVGVFRLAMKQGSDNFRESSILDIMDLLKSKNIDLLIFEPETTKENIRGVNVENSFENFTENCDLIIANRWDPLLEKVRHKVFTRDIYMRD